MQTLSVAQAISLAVLCGCTPVGALSKPPAAVDAHSAPATQPPISPTQDAPREAEDQDLNALRQFRRAEQQYQAFLQRARGNPEYEDAVAVAEERVEEIRVTIAFLEEGIAIRRAQAAKSP